ncbi:MAG: AAA family ATPase [Patescibacteria group bacterium]|nr:AAA family ATPase [Patescibacteria group bacterium]MDE2015641.1 AAA family ATPase [Patescibacteria group bacterium]MDE2226698.1 AAA family ATPase [Patescibacteria group bacterium]
MPHFLKKLELNGFKSFAGKTTLEFPAGITAIVGPNGSGKSNVVDSIRWLLGERDAKNLRGAKVEDLIFAGTAKKARMGQAQASLHFENANNFFPVDFSEVSVMREIRRDGTSRYFLNKAEILLRDLVDFFAKARLGSRGLIVITQGNSDVFIQASPMARREMVEEILGLREYQLKKSDAERRLKNSQINLDKARALTEEILPHLRSLKRQTSRWEKRGSLEEELKGLENIFFGTQFKDIKEKLGEIQKRMNAERGEFAVLEKEKKSAEVRQAEVESSQPEERKDLEKIKAQTQQLLEKKSVLQKELGRIEGQMEMVEKAAVSSPQAHSTAKLLAVLKNIKTILETGLRGDMVEMQEAIRSATEEIEDILSDRGKDLPGKTAPDAGLKPQFEKINRDLKSLEVDILDLKAKEQLLEKNQEQFYHSFKAAVAGVEAAKDKIEKWEAKNREILFEKERLTMRLEETARQAVQAGRKPEEFNGIDVSGANANEDASQMERKIFKLRGDLASIGEIDEALMKEARDTETRYEFLKKESEDLDKAVRDLRVLIKDLNEKISIEFETALVKINEEFGKFFETMFSGGHARLKIVKKEARSIVEDDLGDSNEGLPDVVKIDEEAAEDDGGIEIELHLPRKKINSLEMLSGGERSLVGIAALFALISVSPPPFLVLDEIDAALDERNARRFAEMLKTFAKKTQFVVVTHNRATMEAADVLYGVTLNEDGTSKILSLKLG